MIDVALLRTEADLLRKNLKHRNEDPAVIEPLVALDQKWRQTTQRLEALQAERNGLAKTKQSAIEHRTRLNQLKKLIDEATEQLKATQAELHSKTALLPNLLSDDVPVGKDATDNKVLSKNGTISLKHGRSHEELMKNNGWLNLEMAAEASGARFRYLLGAGAKAHHKLFSQAIDFATNRGFELVIPPVIARTETLESTGFFPRGKDDTFQVSDNQFLVGTSEPLLLFLAAKKTFTASDLPKRYVGFSTCFRKEAGSYGRDVKGMFRVHQFDKVELVSICRPEDSASEHERIVSLQEEFVQSFGVPYRKVLLCSGDQSHIAAKQIDIEAWFPSQEQYRETHSASNCTDYQARLLKTKISTEQGTVLAHTLNGTLATERLLLAIIENHQDKDGQIHLPVSLQ